MIVTPIGGERTWINIMMMQKVVETVAGCDIFIGASDPQIISTEIPFDGMMDMCVRSAKMLQESFRQPGRAFVSLDED